MTTQTPPHQLRVSTVHLIALLLGLAGTALSLLQGRYGLPQTANSKVLILIACVPPIAAIAFALGPRHTHADPSPFRPLRSWMVWGNLLFPPLLTILTLVLAAASGRFENFAGFTLLLAANAGRNLRELVHQLWRGTR